MDDSILAVSVTVNQRKCCVSLKISVIDDISIDDINLFVRTSKGNGRGNNDINNRKRERILCLLPQIQNTKYQHYINDERWRLLRDKFMEILTVLANNIEFDKVTVVSKGGRTHNFDFIVSYYVDNKCVYMIDEVEFKNGTKSLYSGVPQLVSLQVNSQYGVFTRNSGLYDDIFYQNHLEHILQLYVNENIVVPSIPTLEEYKKLVKSENAKVHIMFDMMKKNEKYVAAEKSLLVDKSIEEYLKQISVDDIDFDLIQEKINKTQGNKIYIMWDGYDFFIDNVKKDELTLNRKFSLKDGRNGLANTLVLHTNDDCKSWECLLRWKNHKGILNPAWQIKLK